MEQKVAEGAGLTPQQKQLLDLAIQELYFVKTFYLSGGTALSSWYLHHRESYDLDFFSLVPFDYERITRWFRQNQRTIGYKQVLFDEDYGFLKVQIHYPNQSRLKIDFNHYSPTKLEKGFSWRDLEIDSLVDIATNKLVTIATLPRTRDYVDLFFILKREQWTLDWLIEQSRKKFKDRIDPLQLAKNFLKATEYSDYPTILLPFDKKKMFRFYEQLAQELKPKILK